MRERWKLVDLMFENTPIEVFDKLFTESLECYNWSELLQMCYIEESYERVGGDEGDTEDPPINYERLAYLGKLIEFLHDKGIKAE